MERGTTRGRPKGSRGRGKGKRGRKPRAVISDEEEIETNQQIEEQDPVKTNDPETNANETNKSPVLETAEENTKMEIAQEDDDDDMSQLELEAPSFTTMQRNVPQQVMLRLNWDHKVNLIGEKVLNPMIYICDQCEKPILVYGRMIPCKHVFCLTCARTEAVSKQCPRCKDKVLRVEQTGLGTVFMCTHGGTRYDSIGCRRTYLSQRDLQAHINHRHVSAQVTQDINKTMTNTTDKPPSSQQQQQQQQQSVNVGQQQHNNSHLRKDTMNQSSINKQQFNSSSMYQSSRINENHQHSHSSGLNQQQQMMGNSHTTPTKMSYHHHHHSQDNNGSHGFYNNNQQQGNYGGNSGSNQYNNNSNYGAGSSQNFYQQSYQMNNYSQGQQQQSNWNQQQYFR